MKPKQNDSNNFGKIYKELGPYIGLGLQLGLTVVIMVFLGVWLDGQFGTTPILTIVCSFFGIFAGMYNFIKTATKSRKK